MGCKKRFANLTDDLEIFGNTLFCRCKSVFIRGRLSFWDYS